MKREKPKLCRQQTHIDGDLNRTFLAAGERTDTGHPPIRHPPTDQSTHPTPPPKKKKKSSCPFTLSHSTFPPTPNSPQAFCSSHRQSITAHLRIQRTRSHQLIYRTRRRVANTARVAEDSAVCNCEYHGFKLGKGNYSRLLCTIVSGKRNKERVYFLGGVLLCLIFTLPLSDNVHIVTKGKSAVQHIHIIVCVCVCVHLIHFFKMCEK